MIDFDIGARLIHDSAAAGRITDVDRTVSQIQTIIDRVHDTLNAMPASVTGVIGNVTDLVTAFGTAADSADRIRGTKSEGGMTAENADSAAGYAPSESGGTMQQISTSELYHGGTGHSGLFQYGHHETTGSHNNDASSLAPYPNMFQNGNTGAGLPMSRSTGGTVYLADDFHSNRSVAEISDDRPLDIVGAATEAGNRYGLLQSKGLMVGPDSGSTDHISPAAATFAEDRPSSAYTNPYAKGRQEENETAGDFEKFVHRPQNGNSDTGHFENFDGLYARRIESFNGHVASDGLPTVITYADDGLHFLGDATRRGIMPDSVDTNSEAYSHGQFYHPINANFDHSDDSLSPRNIVRAQSSDIEDVKLGDNALAVNESAARSDFFSTLRGPPFAEATKGMSQLTEILGGLSAGSILNQDKMLAGKSGGVADLWGILRNAGQMLPKAGLPDGENAANNMIGSTLNRPPGTLARLLAGGVEHDLYDNVSGSPIGAVAPAIGRQGPSGHKNDPIYTVAISATTGARMPTVPTPGTNTRTPPIPGQRNLP